ncbi:hypothetical protein D3C84_1200350 [compost metagenome]
MLGGPGLVEALARHQPTGLCRVGGWARVQVEIQCTPGGIAVAQGLVVQGEILFRKCLFHAAACLVNEQ